MVKIKDGYVMSASEQHYYELDNARPRKTSGRVEYYFKPQTKYPPRIYVFMQAELWCDRNRRPMGLYNALPFLSRPMNKEELEYHHFNWRLCYHQYEHWDKLLFAEEKEAELLDLENPGTGTKFIHQLAAFREKYPLMDQPIQKINPSVKPATPPIQLGKPTESLLADLICFGKEYTAMAISEALLKEREGLDRKPILLTLRRLYQNTVLEEKYRQPITLTWVNEKIEQTETRRRKNFVRRVWKHNRLFALEEIRGKYPGYSETLLGQDLIIKYTKAKRKKCRPVTDLRRCQLQKLATRLQMENLSEKDYHHTCCKIVMLQDAHDQKLPIPLTVRLGEKTLIYSFNWKTRESVIKSFAALANTAGITHQQLQERHREITSSIFSF